MKFNPGDQVFISSPLGSLGPYREAAASALERICLRPVRLDVERGVLRKRGRDEGLVRRVRRRIRKCSAIITLFGARSGLRIPGTDLTLTEHECTAAYELGIPIFAYVTKHSRFFARIQQNAETPQETLLLSLCEVVEPAARPEDLKSKVRRDFRERVEADVSNIRSVVLLPTPVERWGILLSNPEELRRCQPRDFERLVAELLEADGWNVELVVRSNAPGPDIIACSTGLVDGTPIKLLVECKKYVDRPVQVGEVRNLVYWVNEEYQATLGMIATTSWFTQRAVQLVEHRHRWRIALKDQAGILDWLGRHPSLGLAT